MPFFTRTNDTLNTSADLVALGIHFYLVRDGHLNLATTLHVKAHWNCLITGSLEMS